MIPEGYLDLLTSTALAHIATIGARGEPQSTPVWFGWDGMYIRFSQTKRQQKYRNLLRNPRVALSIVDPLNPYRYLEVRGVAVAFEDDPDRSFVDSMEREPEAFALVRALLGFGRGLGLTVTAEGVEKPAQAVALQQEGCQQAQGYLYSRAMSANDALDFIRKNEKEVAPAQAHVA